MESEEKFQTAWEQSGSWESRAALCGSPVYDRLEAVRQAVLERCHVCSEFAPTLENPFYPLHSITESMQFIGSELKNILPCFTAVDEGRIRKLTLRLPDGSRMVWEQVPLNDFSASFSGGSLTLKEGKLNLVFTWEGDQLFLEGSRLMLYAECFTAEELLERYPVLLPHSCNLSRPGDWLFTIHGLLKNLLLPEQEIDLAFRLAESSGAKRELALLTSPAKNEWICNGESGSGTIREEDAWSRTKESPIDSGIAEVRRLLTEHTGADGEQPFGEDVPYSQLDVFSSTWSRTVRNESRRHVARSSEGLALQVRCECRHDPVDDLPFLADSFGEGQWQILAEEALAYESSLTYRAAPISRPVSGNGARTDRYRRFTVKVECAFDSCGLQYL